MTQLNPAIPLHIAPMLACLNLSSVDNITFVGQSYDFVGKRIFGGQVLAQALMAALSTTDLLAHSMHAYFLIGGDASQPVTYTVSVMRDGRSFSSRQVHAYQNDQLIFTAMVSCARAEAGLDYQCPAPTVPDHSVLMDEETLKNFVRSHVPAAYLDRFNLQRPLEFKPVNPSNPFKPVKEAPHKSTWMRMPHPIELSAQQQQALLAFASDYTLMGAGLMPHGYGFASPDMMCASLDHTLHFHHPSNICDYLLYHINSTCTSSARGINYGQFWQNGQLVASTSQEGLMRLRTNN